MGVRGVFSDWSATTTVYANSVGADEGIGPTVRNPDAPARP